MHIEQIRELLIQGDSERLKELVKLALKEGMSPKEILDKALITGMDEIGKRFKENEIFIPEVIISADAMQQALSIIEPYLVEAGVKPKGRIVIGTVKGDLHDIGKNLVSMMLKGAGFSILDCGIDVPPNRFADIIKREGIEILAMSSLLTTSMPSMEQTIKELEKQNLRHRVKIMVGGAPVTEGFSRQIGADGYGKDAAEAVILARKFIESSEKV